MNGAAVSDSLSFRPRGYSLPSDSPPSPYSPRCYSTSSFIASPDENRPNGSSASATTTDPPSGFRTLQTLDQLRVLRG
ncbi:unnamed protein product [Soboliphyme baturini]|uniref:Uncharacterized protein n=1 Tax=Soboliphyme baturini TaxID=241478 RepID=A0A183J8I1_9BILA|nr:unnamed protein product [Soboliphyme baturini]